MGLTGRTFGLTEQEDAMKMNPYLSFKGDCEAAFKYYEQHLGGEMGAIFRYGGTPLSGSVPADWPDKIMHGSITIGGQTLQAADVAPGQYESPQGFSLTLQIKSAADAERMFEALASGGQVRLAAREDLLGRALRYGHRSLWCAVDRQLRGVAQSDPSGDVR
jgi:PhnB protein